MRLRKKGDVLVCTEATGLESVTVGKEYTVLGANEQDFAIQDDEEWFSYSQADLRDDCRDGVLEFKERS